MPKFSHFWPFSALLDPTSHLSTDLLASGSPDATNFLRGDGTWTAPKATVDTRSLAQTGAVASLATYTVGAADASFLVSGNINITASATHSIGITVTYTDETGASRTLYLNFCTLAGAFLVAVTNTQGAGPYSGVPAQIRCKAGTIITLAMTGTFTSVTYNAEGIINQVA